MKFRAHTSAALAALVLVLAQPDPALADADCKGFWGMFSPDGAQWGNVIATLATGDRVTMNSSSDFRYWLNPFDYGGTGQSGNRTYIVPTNQPYNRLHVVIYYQYPSGPSYSSFAWICTPAAQVAITHYGITQGHTLLSQQLGQTRQVERLGDFGAPGVNAGGTAVGFTAQEQRMLDTATSGAGLPRLGLGQGGARSSLAGHLRPGMGDDDGPMWLGRPNRQDNVTPLAGNLAGLSFSGAGDGGGPFNFAVSLRDVAQASAEQERQRLAQNPAAAALGFAGISSKVPNATANPLDVWVEGRFSSFNDGRNGADVHGRTGLLGLGIDYVFTRNLLAGVSLSFDTSTQKTSAIGRETNGNGWLAGPYATLRIAPDLYWQTRLAAGRSNTEATHGTNTPESFGSTRWLGTTKITGRYQMGGAWQLRPSASVSYMEETSDEFANGAGGAPTVVKTRIGTASAGPEIGYQMRLANGWLMEPRVGAEAIWTFTRDISIGGTSETFAGDAIGPPGVRGRVEIGLRTAVAGGTALDLSAAYDGIGAGDYNDVTGRAVLRMPLN